ncbi:CDP-alcohol phosphatidyltransferase family protein [bacterium]|nr:CDP-alcohol phosphatidyltransferase family protein [bacterium]
MYPNLITVGRIILALFVIVMFGLGFWWRIAAVALTILVIYLDSLDGYVARKLKQASDVGALFDITGDRIVEHIYLIYYCAVGLVSVWVPIVFVTRSFLVDTLRSVAFSREGKTPFGRNTMMKSPVTRFLAASRVSRAVYGVSKILAFVLLGLIHAFRAGFEQGIQWLSPGQVRDLMVFTQTLVWIMVVLNLIRGIPVLWDGKYYLFDKYLPRELKKEL